MKKYDVEQARELRNNLTDAEKMLWQILKDKQLNGRKFRRQQLIGEYIVDFICHEKKLVVEVFRGARAGQKEYDDKKDAWLAGCGYSIMKFQNDEVYADIEAVKRSILAKMKAAAPAVPPADGEK